ncbi:cyclopropane mycolic acid synthase family methyltransferase [Nocardia anaemiae]|uniref:cyclopropane mycolic acid synthase family methyltransferase n=1 Tax=Nocardia anaemiae TaxID=263910 RepID=UPI0007A388AC|nr:cyclopropane mycolic acid synthase family methyltransferase [Nocardia anaemiae]
MNITTPSYADVQAHYDLSDDFFALFLDESRTYSCAYFESDSYTLEQAQAAKIDLALGKLDLRPGMKLLDIGCGWGSLMARAQDHFSVDVIGLTLSRNQHEYVATQLARRAETGGEVRLQGWEEFEGRADRIVSIGAFEHFRQERYEAFFEFAYNILPTSGRMLLHTIVVSGRDKLHERGDRLSRDDLAFMRFIRDVIFPGGQLPLATGSGPLRGVREYAENGGFTVERMHSLQQHYAKTLDEWANRLADNRVRAVELCGEDIYDTYMRYLTGCANGFRRGIFDVMQFTCVKN